MDIWFCVVLSPVCFSPYFKLFLFIFTEFQPKCFMFFLWCFENLLMGVMVWGMGWGEALRCKLPGWKKKKGYLKVSAHSLGYEWFMVKLVLWRKNNATQTEEIVSFLSMETSLAACILLNLVLSSCNRGEQAKPVRYKKGKSSTAFFLLCILPQKQMNGFLHWLEDIEGNSFFMH